MVRSRPQGERQHEQDGGIPPEDAFIALLARAGVGVSRSSPKVKKEAVFSVYGLFRRRRRHHQRRSASLEPIAQRGVAFATVAANVLRNDPGVIKRGESAHEHFHPFFYH